MINIQNTRDIVQPWTHWLFYGDPGSGKTTLAATFPDPLFIVPHVERSELTLAGRDVPFIRLGIDDKGKPTPPKAHMLQVLRELETRHARMGECLLKGDEAGAFDAFPWQTLVLESMSHYCSIIQTEIAGGKQMDMQKWGQLADHMRELHQRLRAFQCHVVFTAHAKIEGEGIAATGGPDLPGQTGKRLPSACDGIGYCASVEQGAKDTAYQVHFKQHRVFPARTRFADMPKFWENLTFDKMEAYLPK